MKPLILIFIIIVSFIFGSQCFAQSNKKGKMESKEIIIKTDSVEICAESFGNPKDPAILLIMGATASMVWWDEEFCQRLADSGRFVIRFDNRDVGRSTAYAPGQPVYDVLDMADDALRVLDYYNIKQANLAGMSLGGMIAQLVALRNPERALTITLISSSVWDDRPDLPPIDKKILDYHSSGATVNWSDKHSVIEYMVNGWQLLKGSKHPFDKNRAYKLAENEANRARNLLSMFNHSLLKGGESFYGKEKEITVPTLVIHGTEDPVLPFKHAEALIKSIPGAKLLTLEGIGHEIPLPEWDKIISAIVTHTSQ